MEVKVFDCEYKGDCDNKIVVHKRHYGINVINKWEVLYPIESEYERRNSVTFPTKEHAILFANALAGNNNDNNYKVGDDVYYFEIDDIPRIKYGMVMKKNESRNYTPRYQVADTGRWFNYDEIFHTEDEARQSIKLVEDN